MDVAKWIFCGLSIVMLAFDAVGQGTRLLRQPSVSGNAIAFVYAGDVWIVSHQGGDAKRLTSTPETEEVPHFSPDGELIAYTSNYNGNRDVYVIPSTGGEPTRLTFHPGVDLATGWTPDGEGVLLTSGRGNPPNMIQQLWAVPREGGFPERLPFPIAREPSYSPSGDRLAYVATMPAFTAWRHYRGGRTTPIWIADLDDLAIEKIPRNNSNDYSPMWVGDTIYFLSDRNGTANLYSFDVNSKAIRQLTRHVDFDVKTADAGGGVIVYEQAGYLHRYSLADGSSSPIAIVATGDFPWARPHFEKVAEMVRGIGLSPKGVRAVVEARGDIFTMPGKKGDVRNITASAGVHDRYPAWSPDGESLAWFSDDGGEYQLVIAGQKGLDSPRKIAFDKPSFYYNPAWSPDSKKILFTDKHLNVWFVNVGNGKATKVDTDGFSHPQRSLDPVWSPDSKWIAYAKRLDNQLRTIFVYSLDKRRAFQITDGLSDAVSPAFDRGGKYLYFAASTNYGLNIGWLDMTSYDHSVQRGLYLAVLDKKEPSPFLPESDEEEKAEKSDEKEEDDSDSEVEVRIDVEGIDQRILALDVPLRSYSNLQAGGEGILFYAESVVNEEGLKLHKYDLSERESKGFLEGISNYAVSQDGKKLLYAASGGKLGIVETAKEVKVGDGALKTAELQAKVDPRAEWAQIYLEGWRINRDFYYDEKMHGDDWAASYEKYKPFIEHINHRGDLSYVLSMLIGELVSGHSRTGGGDYPDSEPVSVGLLGADFEVADGRYRIARILTGENWNPTLRAPLSAPGIDAEVGDYLLEVNGVAVESERNLFSYFEGTAGKQTILKLSASASGRNARTITVVPVGNERALRSRAWVEGNRRKVDELSGGRLAYVYLPNTSNSGYAYFNRYYFAQQHKLGAIIDERFNGGGSIADYIVDVLDRKLTSQWATRDGKEFTSPNAAIYGPKVMIINEFAGSGGDYLPYSFQKRRVGKLVGTRTWGGLIGVYDYPILIDGGSITAPRLAIFSTDGEWVVENVGVSPDVEVEQLPAPVAAGHDPQLERAVEVALDELAANPPVKAPRPAPIDRNVWKQSP